MCMYYIKLQKIVLNPYTQKSEIWFLNFYLSY